MTKTCHLKTTDKEETTVHSKTTGLERETEIRINKYLITDISCNKVNGLLYEISINITMIDIIYENFFYSIIELF